VTEPHWQAVIKEKSPSPTTACHLFSINDFAIFGKGGTVSYTITRRTFLEACGARLAVFPGLFHRPAEVKTNLFRQSNPIERKDVRDMTEPEIALYKKAFQKLWKREQRPVPLPGKEEMEALEHTSMVYQALLHTHYCPHNNWWLLPWHRAYLFYFEKLLQDAVRNLNPPKLPTIPYWNWSYDLEIPSMFLGDFPDNPLGNNRRFPSPLLERQVNEDKIWELVDQVHSFTKFGSGRANGLKVPGTASFFERGPHMLVHGKIGGIGGDFADLNIAAFDPIFWSHHANIDRLWNRWLCNREREHKNPDINDPQDKPWHEEKFDMFVDTKGNKLVEKMTVADIMKNTEIQSVIYLPHGEAPPQCVPPIPLSHRSSHRNIVHVATVKAAHQQQLIINKGAHISVRSDTAQRKQLAAISAAAPYQDDGEVTLLLRGIRLSERLPYLYVHAFLNKRATAATPTSDESYIGYFILYPAGHQRQHPIEPGQAHVEEFSQAVHLTPTLRRLQRLRKLNIAKPLEVTLVMLPFDDSASAPKPPANLKLPFREAILQISR
jgi:tyrosinase